MLQPTSSFAPHLTVRIDEHRIVQAFRPGRLWLRLAQARTDDPVSAHREPITAGAQTMGTQDRLASARPNLNKVARKYGVESEVETGFVEMIAWAGSSEAPRTALNKELEAVGYARTDYDTLTSDKNHITFFKLVNPDDRRNAVRYVGQG